MFLFIQIYFQAVKVDKNLHQSYEEYMDSPITTGENVEGAVIYTVQNTSGQFQLG